MKNTAAYSQEYYGQQVKDLTYDSHSERVRLARIVAAVGQEKRVLDVGCYRGIVGECIVRAGNTVFGIDASEDAVREARCRGIDAVVGDLEKPLPFGDAIFDVVVAAEILEHILDTEFFLEEIRRVLRPNGLLIITTPNVASLGRRIMLLLGLNPYFEASFGFPPNAVAGHVRFYTADLLVRFLKHKGFVHLTLRSDVVNLGWTASSKWLADVVPQFGRTLIVTAISPQ